MFYLPHKRTDMLVLAWVKREV